MSTPAARLPRLVLLGTGGTIAGAAPAEAGRTSAAYQAAVLGIEQVLASVPGLHALAHLRAEQLFQIDSASLTDAHLLQLAQRVNTLCARPDVDGIVITHGTDTLEESAYFLHLTAKTHKPVVLTGAMRPATALAADGPANLLHAVAVAAHPSSAGRGALVVMNEQIHSGRDLAKTHSQRLDAFASPWGPLGLVAECQPRWYRAASRPHTLHTPFDVSHLHALPLVGLLAGHGNMRPEPLQAWVQAGARAIVCAGPGAGSLHDDLRPSLQALRQQGVWLVRVSRTGAGPVIRNANADDDAQGWITADDQTPARARLLTALALTLTHDWTQAQHWFDSY